MEASHRCCIDVIVFRVRSDEADEPDLGSVVDGDHEPVVAALHVENDAVVPDDTGASVARLDRRRGFPRGPLRHPIPSL